MNSDKSNISNSPSGKRIENLRKIIARENSYTLGNLLIIARKFLTDIPIPALKSEYSQIAETYKYLLHYFIESVSDSQRATMISNLRSRVLILLERIEIAMLEPGSPDEYYSSLRMAHLRGESITALLTRLNSLEPVISLAEQSGSEADMTIRKQAEETLSDLFDTIRTTHPLSKEDTTVIKKNLLKTDSQSLTSQIIAALTLGCLDFYDHNKLMLLMDEYETSPDSRGGAEALAAIILILSKWPERIGPESELPGRMELWQLFEGHTVRLTSVMTELAKTIETQRATETITQDLMNGMKDVDPELIKKLKRTSSTLDISQLEENPEWNELLDKSGLRSKLERLSEMQMDGTDVMMASLANLKGILPFFNKAANWFLPFDINYSALSKGDTEKGTFFTTMMDSAGTLCDSDKYSIALFFMNMSGQELKLKTDMLNEQFRQINEELKSRIPEQAPDFAMCARGFVRNMYRFAYLFKRTGTSGGDGTPFKNLFASHINFFSLPGVGEAADPDFLKFIGEYYFNRGHYGAAFDTFNAAYGKETQDYGLLEKMGYCLQKKGDFTGALSLYEKALLAKPDSKWLKRRLAQCYRNTERLADALPYYKELAEDSDNIKLLLHYADTLYSTGNKEEATQIYYKVNYMAPELTDVSRALAWSELEAGDTEKSLKLSLKLIEEAPTAADFVNAGHACFIAGDRGKAAEFYSNGVTAAGGVTELLKLIDEDSELLLSNGLTRQDLMLMSDHLKLSLE